MEPSPFIIIILLNWNGKADTLACLHSLEKVTYPRFETLVVDNGSTDDSVRAIQEQFPSIEILENGENLGFAEGNNRGIDYALKKGADYIFLLNNDTVVSPSILKDFIHTFKTHPKAGILGATIYLFEEKERLDHLGGMWNSKKWQFDLVGNRELLREGSQTRPIDYVCGAGLIFKKEVAEKVGLLDPRFFLIWEEADFCYRARKAGFDVLTSPATLWHKVSASFVGGKPHSTYFWWRNRLLWIEKNCSLREKLSFFLFYFTPEALHMLKIKAIKSLELSLLKRFKPTLSHSQKEERLKKNHAALIGMRDYFMRRFGNGPRWIYGMGNRGKDLTRKP